MKGTPLKPKQWLIHGIVITIPMVVTLLVLFVVLDFILRILSPIIVLVEYLWVDTPPMALIQVTMLLSLVGFFLLVGIVADFTPGGYFTGMVDKTMSLIPGLGTVYTGVRQATTILLSDDTDEFQDVKLIEFPHENSYMLSFLIEDTPTTINDGVGVEEMQTLMMPLGPNPTTNGFIVHMPTEHVYPVDLTVEEAVQSIATLGIAEERMDK